jgi:hypothetical protein
VKAVGLILALGAAVSLLATIIQTLVAWYSADPRLRKRLVPFIIGCIPLTLVLMGASYYSFTSSSASSTSSPTTTNAVVQAMEVRACMQQHGLKEAHTTISQGETVTFASCDWPPPSYAGADGYSEIKVVTVAGPGQDEASGTNLADRITAPCQELKVSYTLGSQGLYQHLPPFTVNADEIYWRNREIWQGDRSTLSFSPARGEIVILHNDKEILDSATCV